MPSIFEISPKFRRKRVKLTIPDINRLDQAGNPTSVLLLEIEATLQESHAMRSEVADSPIESGATITDHVNVLPREISLDCIITNNPLTLESAIVGNVAGLVGGIVGRASRNNIAAAVATGGLASLATKINSTIVNNNNRVQMALQKLQTAWEGAALITVDSGLTTYNNMIITGITFTRTAQTSGTLPFTVTMREVRLVKSLAIPTPRAVVTKQRRNSATTSTDAGKQTPSAPTPQQVEKVQKSESLLIKGGKFFGVIRP